MNFLKQSLLYTLLFLWGLITIFIGFIFLFFKILFISDFVLGLSCKINDRFSKKITPGLQRLFFTNILTGDIDWDSVKTLRKINSMQERIKMRNKYFDNIINNVDLEQFKGKRYFLSTNQLMYLKLQKIKKNKGLRVKVLFKYMQPQPIEKLTLISSKNLIKNIFSRNFLRTINFLFNYMFMYIVEITVI